MSEINIKPLIEKAKKFMKSAKLLLDVDDFDSSASRIYYAMHYMVEALLLTKNLRIKSHRGLISIFGREFIKTKILPKEVGRQLKDAFDKRQIGDYEISVKINKKDIEELLKIGQRFIEKLMDYLVENNFL
ncbi:MAG: HEPN domain-containing protein [Promethearchaeota archaeon Loki_b32]|nr:MAG: HEPN domain-containing protein [Candidatus Lokiarchaeota archaeon Loki_b32]